MKTKLFFYLALLVTCNSFSQSKSSTALLKEIHTKYYLGPCKAYTFSQRNTHYRNDSIIDKSVWHEAIEFPDKFKIQFGEKTDGNYVIFKNDSAFNFRKGKFTKARTDSNSLLLILGGMFYRNFDNVIARLQALGYDLSKFSEQNWNGEAVYVVGAMANDSPSNQIWIDKKSLRVVRIIEKMNAQDTMDMRFEAHQDWCKGYVETKVSFRRNGKLEQVEEYYDLKIADKFE